MYSRISAFLLFSFCSLQGMAQRDSVKIAGGIDITSAYKPVLRNAVKINFSGSQLSADTSRPVFNYNVPAQNLFYAYQPISLRPLALAQDSNLYLGNRNYVKAGFGSYTTPYVKAGFSFGDGRTSLVNITGSYIGSKGNDIKYQDYSKTNIKGAGSYFLPGNEVYASALVRQDKYYLYGYDHDKYPNVNKDDIRNQYEEINIAGGVRNTKPNDMGFSYNPNIDISFFTNKDKASETTLKLNVPVEKTLGESFRVKVEANADLTKFSTIGYIPNNIKFNNNIVSVAPSIIYTSPLVKINGGVIPTWNNGDFTLLPNIHAEAQLPEKNFALQGGWIGRYTKNTLKNLVEINPYLAPALFQTNTKEMEYYGGIKATLGKHFNFSAKAGLVQYTNLALFINDTSGVDNDNKFKVINESKAKNFRIHGDLSYINQDKFTFTAGLTLNGYTNLKDNDKAWGTIPMEFTSSVRWWAFQRFMFKADLYLFGGSKYIEKGNTYKTTDGGTDLSIGAEYRINKQFSLWLDANNIFNDKYERWHNYQVYGLNLTGGILIKF
jgi:hypothetical protein